MLADEVEHLIKPPLKRSASESGAAEGRSAPSGSRSDSRIPDNDNPSVMDWNAGESPLLAWLNRIATPAAAAEDTWFNNYQQDPHITKGEEILNQEKQDIEVFKNIHISTSSQSITMSTFYPGTDGGSDLELPAQIYYRNIKDRYPSLPHFLTRRLAIANVNRATRLEQQRITRGRSGLNTTSTGDLSSIALLSNQILWSSRGEFSKERSRSRSRSRSKEPQDTFQSKLMYNEVSPNLLPRFDLLDKARRASLPLSQRNFWTAGRSSHRASSVRSDSSSKNSSLRGLDVMDSSYQRQNVVENHKEDIFSAASSPNRGLFPAPIGWTSVDHGRKTCSFHCEICGALVQPGRRRDWQ